jgi:dihydroxy-acid dehydratase
MSYSPNTNRTGSSSTENPMPSGLRKGLTSYGDPGFSLFLRKAFINAKGFSGERRARPPIIGINSRHLPARETPPSRD